MRRAIAPLLLLAAAPTWAVSNFATCLLSDLPGTMNDQAAQAIYRVCLDKYPRDAAQGSGRGLFSYKSGAECLAAKAKDTRSNRAAQLIGVACRKLYDEDGPWLKYQNR